MAKNTNIHTADRIETVAKESAQWKQSGNTRALLLQNLPGAREVRSFFWWTLGILESTWDTLYRTLTLAARPQDLKNSGKIIRNGIKTIIAETPQIETHGSKEYIQNLRASKLQRDSWKQYHEPYLDDTKFFDTHGTDLSLAPNKSDHWFKKWIKGIPFIAGKTIKTPVWAASTVIWAVTDTFRWMKAQKLRDLITLKFHKTSRNKTSHAWKKLTSRAYKGNTSWNLEEENKKQADTSSRKARRSRLRPFGKKKSKQETKESEKTKNKKAVILTSTTPEEKSSEVKKETIQEKDIIKEEKSSEKKDKSTESKDEVDIMKDYKTSFKSIQPLKTAFQQKNKEELEKHKNIILETNTENIEEDYEQLNPTQQKIIDDIKSVQKRIKNWEYEISEWEIETITNDQRELLKNWYNNIKEYKKALEEKNKNNFNNSIDKIGKAEEAFRITDSSKLSEEEQSMLQDIKNALKEIRETKFDDTRT